MMEPPCPTRIVRLKSPDDGQCGAASVRLIDSYAEGVIDKAEFEPRIAGLKQRLSQLQERHQAALEAAEVER